MFVKNALGALSQISRDSNFLSKKYKITSILKEIFFSIKQKKLSKTKNLLRTLKKNIGNGRFDNNSQQDAQEFFVLLIETLHHELNRVSHPIPIGETKGITKYNLRESVKKNII